MTKQGRPVGWEDGRRESQERRLAWGFSVVRGGGWDEGAQPTLEAAASPEGENT